MELALSWQDVLITLSNLALLVAMVPEFASRPKMSLYTSIPAATSLLMLTIAYVTLGLVAAGIASAITMLLWLVLIHDKVAATKVSKRKRK